MGQKFKIFISIAFPIILILSVILVPYKKSVIIYHQNTYDVLAFIPVEKPFEFAMKYTHSIHLSDVVESYRLTRNNEIQQYELMYKDTAIGMPANAEAGEKFVQKDGMFFIKNMNRIFPYFDLRTGKVRANHRIIYNTIEYPLSETIKPGTWIRIKVGKLSLWQQLKGVNLIGT